MLLLAGRGQRLAGAGAAGHGERAHAGIPFCTQHGDATTKLAYEAQVLLAVRHPNVVQSFGFVHASARGPAELTMELCAGTLSAFLQLDGHLLDFPARCRLAVNICEGMAHVHSKGVVHYDLKANNVLIVFSGNKPVAKVSDFGYSRTVDPATGYALAHDGESAATIPEVAAAQAGHRSMNCVTTALDVWLFGRQVLPRLFGKWIDVDKSEDDRAFIAALVDSCTRPDPRE